MRIFAFLLLVCTACSVWAEGPARGARGHRGEPDGPWLGVDLTWIEKGTAAQLKDVPKGFGLLVEEVEPESPASAAGLLPLDILWKFNDQFVANKWQLYALMKMEGVGAEVKLSISRAGETMVVPLTIGVRPERQDEIAKAAKEVLMPPIPGDFVRKWDVGKRSGFIADGDVTVALSESVEGYLYTVTKDEELLSQGILTSSDERLWPKTIDEQTRRKLEALFQSLFNAEERESKQQTVPRVRRVPTPKNSAKK